MPEIRLKVTEGFAPGMHQELLQGSIDLAILSGSTYLANVEVSPLLSEAICVIARSDDRRLTDVPVDIGVLTGIPLVLTGIAKSGIRLELEPAAARRGIRLNTVVEVESASAAQALVERGVGWTVHFAAAVGDGVSAGLLRATPIVGLSLQRSIGRSLGRPPSTAANAVAATLRKMIEHMVADGHWPNTVLFE